MPYGIRRGAQKASLRNGLQLEKTGALVFSNCDYNIEQGVCQFKISINFLYLSLQSFNLTVFFFLDIPGESGDNMTVIIL